MTTAADVLGILKAHAALPRVRVDDLRVGDLIVCPDITEPDPGPGGFRGWCTAIVTHVDEAWRTMDWPTITVQRMSPPTHDVSRFLDPMSFSWSAHPENRGQYRVAAPLTRAEPAPTYDPPRVARSGRSFDFAGHRVRLEAGADQPVEPIVEFIVDAITAALTCEVTS